MKSLRKFLKKLDVFGVPYSFKYKGDEKYTTATGGLIIIIFAVTVLGFGTYFFIPFYNRKNLNIIYYSMNMPVTDSIRLYESKANFAVGIDCGLDKKTNLSGDDLFNVEIAYIVYTKDHEGNRNKDIKILGSHKCNYADFYNKYNDSLDYVSIHKFECLDKIDNEIKGIYNDEVFSYYELSVVAKENTPEHFQKIDGYLREMDCKFQLFYTDVTIDFDDYEDPIKPYLNSLYVQMNPTLFLKMNAFFMNQYFENDDYLFFVLNEKESVHTLFSRADGWSLYKGLDRGNSKPTDYKNYAKIYIRADTKKTTIKRKYQKVMEFYADYSSMFIAVFEILYFIFSYMNSFYADHSLSKKLFFFVGTKNKYFNINERYKQIMKLISLTDPFCKYNLSSNDDKNTINLKALKEDEINIYNRNKYEINDKDNLSTEKRFANPKAFQKKGKLKKKKKKKNSNEKMKTNVEDDIYTQTNQPNFRKNELVSGINLRSKLVNSIQRSTSDGSATTVGKSYSKKGTIKFSYNIFEIFFRSILCCKNFRKKLSLSKKALNILNEKMDIALYIKNTFLLDIMSQSLIDDKRQSIIKFICRPTLSERMEDRELREFYTNYTEKDFDRFNDELLELIKESNLQKYEQNLIALSNMELKEMIY